MADGFEEIEAISVVDILRRANIEVLMVSIMGRKEVVGAHQIAVMADALFGYVDYSQIEMIILPGGGQGKQQTDARRNAAEVEDAGAVLVAELMEEVHQDAVQREPVLVAVPDDEAVGLEIIQPRHDAVADEIPRRAGHRRDKHAANSRT